MAEPVVVIGSSIAALVAADTAGRLGADVQLLLTGAPGAGFTRIPYEGRQLQLGLRLLELSYGTDEAPMPSLEAYEPGASGHVPFLPLVRRMLEDLGDGSLRRVATPQISLHGVVGPDVHLTADLRHLPALVDNRVLARIAAEAAAAEAKNGPAGVLRDALSPELTLEAASLRNHGPTFHGLLVEPLCTKIVPGGAAAIAAASRRKAWVALFHPRTLAQAASRRPVDYAPDRPFHADASGGCADVVERLIARVRCSSSVAVRRVGRLTALDSGGARFDDGTAVACRRPIVGVSADELFAAAGVAHRARRTIVDIAWAEVATDRVAALPSTVLLADPDIPAYRVGPGGIGRPGTTLLAVELATGVAGEDASAALATAARAARIVLDDAPVDVVHRVAVPAAVDPSSAAAAEFATARAAVDDRLPALEIVGGAAAHGADSLNEQIVQGLRAAHALAA